MGTILFGTGFLVAVAVAVWLAVRDRPVHLPPSRSLPPPTGTDNPTPGWYGGSPSPDYGGGSPGGGDSGGGGGSGS
ncbi:hypothetical protein [Winogradskya humida]|uniref:Uncharacterized protein n=1 Tax=Winogradskya humida TaxID=113566 RepID=A0ABQ3ZN47_9ACTN|nr:hypothetical protein [Actinoplanes humidus]GIE19962.1 hypothetical protein Ahu01nite_030640 [Actinoplanes humidus]